MLTQPLSWLRFNGSPVKAILEIPAKAVADYENAATDQTSATQAASAVPTEAEKHADEQNKVEIKKIIPEIKSSKSATSAFWSSLSTSSDNDLTFSSAPSKKPSGSYEIPKNSALEDINSKNGNWFGSFVRMWNAEEAFSDCVNDDGVCDNYFNIATEFLNALENFVNELDTLLGTTEDEKKLRQLEA